MNRMITFTVQAVARPVNLDEVHKQFSGMTATQSTVGYLRDVVNNIHMVARADGRNIPNAEEYRALKRLHNVGEYLATFSHLAVPDSCFLTKVEYDAVE